LQHAAERLTSAVIVRLHYICGLILLVFAGAALGEGRYQRTKDGKTMVWNNDPKRGDAATWFGDRDAEGYATKVGTLTWYTANGTVYARYFGNMVRGKFDGMVNSHSKGKTDHAIFVDGQRTTRWVAGRAPSLRVAQPRIAPVKPTAKIAKANSEIGNQASDVSVRLQRRADEQPAEPPMKDNLAAKEPLNARGEEKPERPTEDIPAEGPGLDVRKTENAPRPTLNPEIGRQGPVESEKAQVPRSKSATAESPQASAANPQPTTTPGWPQIDVDDSLQSLAQPPSSLHANPETAAAPEARPHLTKEEVIKIANAAARARGYKRTDYHRTEPQYDPAYKVWSVSYEQSAADGMGKRFSVIVDDKTRGAVFELRR
jgi:hypothetical protein